MRHEYHEILCYLTKIWWLIIEKQLCVSMNKHDKIEIANYFGYIPEIEPASAATLNHPGFDFL